MLRGYYRLAKLAEDCDAQNQCIGIGSACQTPRRQRASKRKSKLSLAKPVIFCANKLDDVRLNSESARIHGYPTLGIGGFAGVCHAFGVQPASRSQGGARSRLHRDRIDRSCQRASCANGWPRAQRRRQICDCGGSSQPQRHALHYRLARISRCERAGSTTNLLVTAQFSTSRTDQCKYRSGTIPAACRCFQEVTKNGTQPKPARPRLVRCLCVAPAAC